MAGEVLTVTKRRLENAVRVPPRLHVSIAQSSVEIYEEQEMKTYPSIAGLQARSVFAS